MRTDVYWLKNGRFRSDSEDDPFDLIEVWEPEANEEKYYCFTDDMEGRGNPKYCLVEPFEEMRNGCYVTSSGKEWKYCDPIDPKYIGK